MNMREAFEAAWCEIFQVDGFGVPDYDLASIKRLETMFQAGAAFAARECAQIVRGLPANREGMLATIREAFPEVFR